MGAVLSHLRNLWHQLPEPRYHQHVWQQLSPGCGPSLLIHNGDAASLSVVDLFTRLVFLDKDLQISRLESSLSNSLFKEVTEQLKEQLLVQETTIDRIIKENEEIKHRLMRVEEAINALSTPSIPNSRPQSTSTSFSTSNDAPSQKGVVSEDLIDLLDTCHEASSTKLTDEETTLHDEVSEDELDVERASENATPDYSLHRSPIWKSQESSYIVRFANEDSTLPTKKVRPYCGSPGSVKAPQSKDNVHSLLEQSDDSSPDTLSSPSDPNSTRSSFTSTSDGSDNVGDVYFKRNEESLQLKALGSKDGIWDESMAVDPTSAGSFSIFCTRTQAGQPVPARRVPSGSAIKPRWSPLDSSQNSEKAGWINHSGGRAGVGARPEFFKYGIHYIPKNHELNLYRTVAVSGLPPSITMKALLEKVRGGLLIDAKLLDTAKITGDNTALVTFLHERAAFAYKDYTKHHPIVFSNTVARVAVVPTPTWPMPFSLLSHIERDGYTRCFEVYHMPRNISLPVLRMELTSSPVMKSDSLECMNMGADGALELRFSSIRAAVYSSTTFFMAIRYRGCTIKYIPDPCAQPLETLLEGTNTPEAILQDVPKSYNDSDAEAGTNGEYGRPSKPDWNIKPVHRRGRGFTDQAVSTTEKKSLRQETAATIAAFAESHFRSE